MDFVRKNKENYNTTQTTAIVDVEWRVSFLSHSLPKPTSCKAFPLHFVISAATVKKKSSKPNCVISLHQTLSPTAISWKPGWRLQESRSDQSTPSLLRHACFPKGLSVHLPMRSKSSAGQLQMKGGFLANTPNCYESSLPRLLASPIVAAALLQASLLASQIFRCQQV